MAAVPSIGRAREVEQTSSAPGARLERLYERHSHRVFGFCLYQLRDRDEAADAAQTTFLHALRATRQGVVPVSEAPWLLAIARNVCRSRWDSGRRRGEVEFAHDPHRLAEIAAGREATDELLGLEHALAALAEPQRQAVLLRDWQGLSYREVAEHLGITVSAAESLIFRGRDALARALNGDDPHAQDPRRRRLGLSSLASAIKPGLLGGSVAAKVAAGAALVAVGVSAGASILRHDATPRRLPSPQVATSSDRAGSAAGIDPGSRAPTTHHAQAARAPGDRAARHSSYRFEQWWLRGRNATRDVDPAGLASCACPRSRARKHARHFATRRAGARADRPMGDDRADDRRAGRPNDTGHHGDHRLDGGDDRNFRRHRCHRHRSIGRRQHRADGTGRHRDHSAPTGSRSVGAGAGGPPSLVRGSRSIRHHPPNGRRQDPRQGSPWGHNCGRNDYAASQDTHMVIAVGDWRGWSGLL